MKIFKEIGLFRAYRKEIQNIGETVGLVPTMGALHRGHISLIEASKKANNTTIATIYINPAQFNNPADLQRYPRTPDQDFEMLEEAGCDAVLFPQDSEMYNGQPVLKFDFGHVDKVMEGKFRPGHFSGVALVVAKLFHITEPEKAYFGQKDWQQLAIIRRLVSELRFNLEVCSVPIVREADGLAMSSRNTRLSGSQRIQSTVLFRALNAARDMLRNGQTLESVKGSVKQLVESEPEMKLEYFELADRAELAPLQVTAGEPGLIMCIAAYAGDVRLIDNMFLD